MIRALSRNTLAAAALVLFLPLGFALAQEPKIGSDWYEDAVDIGFKLKVPKNWNLIPAQPDEPNVIAKYVAARNDYIKVGNGNNMPIYAWLVRFDQRSEEEKKKTIHHEGEEITFSIEGESNIADWMEDMPYGRGWHFDTKKYPKKLKVKGAEGKYWLYEGSFVFDPEETIRCYVAEFTLGPKLKVALVGNGPGDKRWRNYERGWAKMAKSFAAVEVEAPETTPALGVSSPRDEKRAALTKEMARTPGWELYETENYFVVSDVDDKEFMEELLERLEAIRDVYEVDYPAEKARSTRREKKDGPEASEDGGVVIKDSEEEENDDDADRSISTLRSMELSRTSVVRVCQNADTYYDYGGSRLSAGFWNSSTEELVIFDDKESGWSQRHVARPESRGLSPVHLLLLRQPRAPQLVQRGHRRLL